MKDRIFEEALAYPGWIRVIGGFGAILAAVVLGVALARRDTMTIGDFAGLVVTCAIGLLAAAATVVGRQRIVVTRTSLHLRLTPGWRKTVALADIVESEPFRPTFGLEYAGYGVRLAGRRTTAIVANPGPCVKIIVGGRRPRTYIIRTDHPDELLASLRSATEPAGVPSDHSHGPRGGAQQ